MEQGDVALGLFRGPRSTSPLPQAVLAPLIIGLLAFALRVYRLGYQSLWYDEGFSAYLARSPLAELIDYRGMDPHPPLHAVSLGLWTSLAGDSEVALRFPSALAGTVGVILVFRLGASLLGSQTGTYAALLAAVNPFLIYYAQEARPYSFLLALSLGSTILLVHLVRPRPTHPSTSSRPRPGESPAETGRMELGRWAAYVAVTALALWSHYFAVFTLAGHWFLWLIACRRYRPMGCPRLRRGYGLSGCGRAGVAGGDGTADTHGLHAGAGG